MSFNITEFSSTIDDFHATLKKTPEAKTVIRLAEDKWTLKEMIGHLIDSASNNHQRWVRMQLEETLSFPQYEPEPWKNIQKVNNFDWNSLIQLWKSYNDFLIYSIQNIDQKNLSHLWLKGDTPLTLEFIINDYFSHIRFHVNLFNDRVKEIDARTGDS
jgi:hypothetical protein